MDTAHKLYEIFTKSANPKDILDAAYEIKKHFVNVSDKEPSDEIGEELLYIIGAKKETFEWFVLLIILCMNEDRCEEYFTALNIKKSQINISQCEWTKLIIKEIQPEMNDVFVVHSNNLINNIDKAKEDLISKQIEKFEKEISNKKENELSINEEMHIQDSTRKKWWHLFKSKPKIKNEKSFTDDINAGKFASKQMILVPTLKDIEYHIKLDIETYSPNRVLIVPLGEDFSISIMEELKSSEKIARRFKGNITSNENISLKWLSQAASQIRKSHVNAILISNYPRDTNPPRVQYRQAGKLITSKLPARTSLRICDKKDTTSLLAIYLVDIYSKGYIDNLFFSQAQDRENLTRLQVLVPENDLWRNIPEEERNKIKSATNKIEQHHALENLASKLELEPEISFYPSVVFQGPILT